MWYGCTIHRRGTDCVLRILAKITECYVMIEAALGCGLGRKVRTYSICRVVTYEDGCHMTNCAGYTYPIGKIKLISYGTEHIPQDYKIWIDDETFFREEHLGVHHVGDWNDVMSSPLYNVVRVTTTEDVEFLLPLEEV